MAINDPVVSNVNFTSDDSFRIAEVGTPPSITSANVLALQNTAGGILKVFKADGTTLAALEVATPTGGSPANMVATKSYVDSAPVVNAAEQIVAKTINWNTSISPMPTSTFALPAGSRVTKVQVIVNPLFDGTGGTLEVGYSGNTSAFMTTAQNNLKAAGVYSREQYTSVGASSVNVLYTFTPATGTPANGKAEVLVWFVIAPKT